MNREIRDIILKNIIEIPKAQFVIYGTKDVALIYYDFIVDKFGEESVCFFIDGKKEMEFFRGKAVYTCSELNREEINNYKYIIGTISKPLLFVNNLLEIGVNDINIIPPITYFSADYIDSNINSIKNIVLYPSIENNNQLVDIMNDLNNYFDITNNHNKFIKILVDKNNYSNPFNCIELINASMISIDENDFILVWKAENLLDNYLKKMKKVFCCDNEVMANLKPKIFSAILKKISQLYSEEDYIMKSKTHYLKMIEKFKNCDNAIVCGCGPSLDKIEELIHNVPNEKLIVVCNGFYKMKNKLTSLKPDIYILKDNLWLTPEFRNELDEIIKYIYENNVFLCVNDKWVPMLYLKYPQIKEQIVGFREDSELNRFPDIKNQSYPGVENVVVSMCLPIASSLAENIFLIGCDGVKNGSWNHANAINYVDNISENNKKIIKRAYRSIEDYEEIVNRVYKKIFAIGEKQNKKYFSLVHSHIKEVEKRYLGDNNTEKIM